MTHQIDSDLLTTVLQFLTDEGSSGFAEGLRLLVNEAMVQERSAVLHARPYERCDARLGRSNGFKPKTLATRGGAIEFRVPQVRDSVDFYPSALEKGVRSEQALMLALAEMYVQGVSTRTVTKIVEDLCCHSVSSSQVSACSAKLDVELQSWRARAAVFPSVPWQRCQFHLQQNAQAYVPRIDLRAKVASDIRSIFNCPDLPTAQARLKLNFQGQNKREAA